MTWDWTGRYKDIQDMKQKNQRHGKTVHFAIENATRLMDDHRSSTYKEDADAGWERTIGTTQLDSLYLVLFHQRKDGRNHNK